MTDRQKISIIFRLLLSLSIIITIFSSCSKNDKTEDYDTTTYPTDTDTGVIINGIKWATRNVDQSGTFAARPESAGMYYRWNHKKAWYTGTSLENYTQTGTTWEKDNDPSPTGWRVPTREEQTKLIEIDKVASEWTSKNGVKGRKFTDIATGNTIFLPAVGIPDDNGKLIYIGMGLYLSSTLSINDFDVCIMPISNDGAYEGSGYGNVGWYSIRSVAETY